MHKILLLATILLFSNAALAQEEESELRALLEKAMSSEVRNEAERERDRNRKPIDTLEFFGINPSMKVLELIPGGGWYTKLLAPVLRDQGELFVSIGTSRVEKNLLGLEGLDKIKVLDSDAEIGKSETPRLRTVAPFSFKESKFDAILTFRNMHNFDALGRQAINEAAFKALKPGGVYGVVDHTRRHMEAFGMENRRRVDPVLAIKEAQAAGFVFVDYSDLHFRADDELRYEVGRKSVTGNTDRFTFLFKKPK
jgi:predicted methyltransferase